MKVYVVKSDENYLMVDDKVYTNKEDAEKVIKEHNAHWRMSFYYIEELELV